MPAAKSQRRPRNSSPAKDLVKLALGAHFRLALHVESKVRQAAIVESRRGVADFQKP
jgi:hypothetical protein